MTCDQFSDIYELYAIGALSAEENAAFEQHLAEGCENCRRGLARAQQLNELIFMATPHVTPSPLLRRRVLASFGLPVRAGGRSFLWSAGLAMAAAVLVVLGVLWNNERQERLSASAELLRLREMQQILQSPDTKRTSFGPQPSEPQGNVYVNGKNNILLIARGLPDAPAGWVYESWVIPKEGAPKPIESFTVRRGGGVSVIQSPLAVDDLKAVAVSLEPENVPVHSPTKVIFAAPIG